MLSNLPHSPDGVEPGLAEVRMVPEVEEVVSLLSGGELLSLQPLVPPLPAKSHEVYLKILKTPSFHDQSYPDPTFILSIDK